MIESLLKDCEKGQGAANRTAISLSIAGALSGIALLALSGWFLTGAALAGAGGLIAVRGFNYLLPSAAIRMLAITRTLSRYGERLIVYLLDQARMLGCAKLMLDTPMSNALGHRFYFRCGLLATALRFVTAVTG